MDSLMPDNILILSFFKFNILSIKIKKYKNVDNLIL
jgi:hypothetical protein